MTEQKTVDSITGDTAAGLGAAAGQAAAAAAAVGQAAGQGTAAAVEQGTAAAGQTDAAAEKAGAATDAKAAESRTADIVAGPGGVMTDEAGVVTGELTLRTELSGTQVTLHVQYKDADEWYVVTGGRSTLKDPADLDAVHTVAVALLNRPEG
jgi:hypothetical protein